MKSEANDSDGHWVTLTPRTPKAKRAPKIGQKESIAIKGESPVTTPLNPSEMPTTWRPPNRSAITPPRSDVTKYPQKKAPRMYDCSFLFQGYLSPYLKRNKKKFNESSGQRTPLDLHPAMSCLYCCCCCLEPWQLGWSKCLYEACKPWSRP